MPGIIYQFQKLVISILLLVFLVGCDGNTEIMKLAISGDPAAIRLSLDKGAEVDAQNLHGWTALEHAADRNQTAIMAVLIDAGADPNHQDKNGWTPLMRASGSGNLRAVQLLISRDAKVDLTEKHGWTALFWATYRGHKDIVRELIAQGANVFQKANDDRSVVDIARSQKYVDIIELLKQAGAD